MDIRNMMSGLEANTRLFDGITPEEADGLLECVHARRVEYAKGELMVEEGSATPCFGLVLSGYAHSVKRDASGRMIIIALLQKGSVFGVLVAASQDCASPVSVEAQDHVSALLIPFDRIITRCEKACPQHDRLLRNYVRIVAEKGLELHERLACLLKPTVRDKIMAYLTQTAREQKSRLFVVPLNRNAMAEYLNVERSALSRELSNMKRDELIDYHLNRFKLL